MEYIPAGPGEILRAAQRDERLLNNLKSRVADLIQKIYGMRTWLLYHEVFENACELLYYGVTTLALKQTLGEEYTGILQLDKNSGHLPIFSVRLLMVALYIVGPLIVRKLLNKLETYLNSTSVSSYLRPEFKMVLLNLTPLLRYSIPFVMKFHIALFYLYGGFYHLSKRILGVKYVLLRRWFGANSVNGSFKMLGIVVSINIILSLFYTLNNISKQKNIKNKSDLADCNVDRSKQCPLCLDVRSCSSAAPCGHVFCWNCVHEWLQSKKECPICRHPTTKSEIIPLLNY